MQLWSKSIVLKSGHSMLESDRTWAPVASISKTFMWLKEAAERNREESEAVPLQRR